MIPTRSLKKGASGDDVKSVQTRLIALGWLTGKADGKYGDATQAAVAAFQKAAKLTVDGIAGSATCKKLFGDSAPAYTAPKTTPAVIPTRILEKGHSGEDVKSVQTRLKELGWYKGTINSKYDAATVAAVTEFQKASSLTPDGKCGSKTSAKLFSDKAVTADKAATNSGSDVKPNVSVSGPAGSQVKLLHWFNDVKPTLKNGGTLKVYDPKSGYGWKLKILSNGRHCDAEPLTAQDTANLKAAFGGVNTWTQQAVYVQLPDGRWSLASTHNMPHLSGSIKDNNFNGHLCVHFLRDMDECTKNDPKYGVSNQQTIRSAWKALTGIVVP